MKFLFIDTETHSLKQPRPVEYGALLMSLEGKRLASLSSLVRPSGWVIEPSAEAVHKISMAQCRQHGHLLVDVYRQFTSILRMADVLVGHNLNFDISNIERDYEYLSRYRSDMPKLYWPEMKYCTMRSLTNYCALPYTGGRRYTVYKWPKLEELYECVFNKEMPYGHRAIDDCKFTADCFFALLKAGIITQSKFEVLSSESII
jgi:DNA polymerase III epsilon subunit-like protein